MSRKNLVLILILLFKVSIIMSQTSQPDVPTPVKIALFQDYTEGIVFDIEGNAFISLPNSDTVLKLSFPGKPEFWFSANNPNGHKVLADGSHILAVAGAVLHISADAELLDTITTGSKGMLLRFPNDITLDKYGGFYLTDPGEGDDLINRQGRIFYVDSAGHTTLAAMNIAYPNGIVLRPDGKTLLVAESGSLQVLEYEVAGVGKLKLNGVFAMLDGTPGDQFTDGMCLDTEGNLYVAIYQGGMVQEIDVEGNVTRYIPSSLHTTSNVAFGGSAKNELYITGGIRDEKGKGGLMMIKLSDTEGLQIIPQKK